MTEPNLTKREAAVLSLLGHDLTIYEIAGRIKLGMRQVRRIVTQLRQKFPGATDAQLAEIGRAMAPVEIVKTRRANSRLGILVCTKPAIVFVQCEPEPAAQRVTLVPSDDHPEFYDGDFVLVRQDDTARFAKTLVSQDPRLLKGALELLRCFDPCLSEPITTPGAHGNISVHVHGERH